MVENTGQGAAQIRDDISIGRLAMLIILPTAALAGLLWYLLGIIQPPPQKLVVIATGSEAGAYHAFGKLYQQQLENAGIKVRLQTSAGAVENMRLLHDPSSGVNVALMQGGIAGKSGASGLVSVGRMFYEPLWIFYKADETISQVGQLRGRRIAVGPEGSGTRALAMALLGAAHVGTDTATLMPISGQAAVDALNSGQADVAMLTFAPEAPVIQGLLHDRSTKLMSLSQADALVSVFPYLSHVRLPEGLIDLENNIPPHVVDLVAPVAAVVVADDLHPALVAQLAKAASAIHARPNLLTKAGEFPKSIDPEYAMSPEAARFYRSGPTLLQRWLPFWIANFIERLLVLLIPLATIAVPLLRGVPAFVRWRVQRKLTHWYRRLEQLENGLRSGEVGQDVQLRQSRELQTIADGVASLRVPRAYAEQYFNLRGHIDLVRQRILPRPRGASD